MLVKLSDLPHGDGKRGPDPKAMAVPGLTQNFHIRFCYSPGMLNLLQRVMHLQNVGGVDYFNRFGCVLCRLHSFGCLRPYDRVYGPLPLDFLARKTISPDYTRSAVQFFLDVTASLRIEDEGEEKGCRTLDYFAVIVFVEPT